MTKIDLTKIKQAGDYVRYLAIECIERSKSGHPGLPLGCADLGSILYRYILRYSPENPQWLNRDRFILSAGHGSMFLYALLHASGYKLSIDDLSNFRQLHSKTPGHPEHELDIGIETTTGPLGQGFANAVGVALEGKMLADRFNKDDFELFNYNVYTLMGDGCTMEGVAYEAASLAGHLGLDNLVAIYDSNDITIDGSTDITLSENVQKRYEALGWEVDTCSSEDLDSFYNKLKTLSKSKGKPKLLIVRTTIGEGLDKLKGTSTIHGSPAGIDEIVYFIQNSTMRSVVAKEYGEDVVADAEKLKEVESKRIQDKVAPLEDKDSISFIQEAQKWNKEIIENWNELLNQYNNKFPAEYAELQRMTEIEVPTSLKNALLNFKDEKADATRNISGRVLALCSNELPQIIGGSADLVCSTKATVKGSAYVEKGNYKGRNIPFGIREHAMGSIGNGLALNGNMIPFTSTFFTFLDYMKPAVRLAALMKLRHLFVFTHDSVYVGEDGPTHQPIEHINSLRLLPDFYCFRPANDAETAFSYLYFLDEISGPAAILGSRQNMPQAAYEFSGTREEQYEGFKKGAYSVYETEKGCTPDVIVAGSGSEAGLALEAARILEKESKKVKVVSIPCLELFQKSDASYKKELFNNNEVPLVFLETASHRGMSAFYRDNILLIDIQEFGISAPAQLVAEEFGFTAQKVADKAEAFLK